MEYIELSASSSHSIVRGLRETEGAFDNLHFLAVGAGYICLEEALKRLFHHAVFLPGRQGDVLGSGHGVMNACEEIQN